MYALAVGILRARDSGRTQVLPARCLIGRSRACDLVLAERDISAEHAALAWSSDRWELQDLGSRNGTFIDGTRLPAGTRASVASGAELRFGRLAPGFVLVDTAAPQLMALRLDDSRVRIGEGGYLVLPDMDDPQCCILLAPDGTWLVEQRGASSPLADRAVLALADGQPWRVHLPAACPSTWNHDDAELVVANLRLRFAVSRDEEHVELRAIAGERELDLQARAHHYLLLVLARRRVADERAGLPDAAQGWIHHDELLAMLRIDDGHLNLSIHRARSQLGRLSVADAAALVERRQSTRELRLGVRHIEIVPLF